MWTAVDPSASKYPGFSPYNYTFDNPLKLVDPDGKDPSDAIMANLYWGQVELAYQQGLTYFKTLLFGGQATAVAGAVVVTAPQTAPVVAKTGQIVYQTVLTHPKETAAIVATTYDVVDAALTPPDPADRGISGFKQIFTAISEFFNRLTKSSLEDE